MKPPSSALPGATLHPNAGCITRFYAAFAERDAEGMVAEYHCDVRFSDPVFQQLRGPRARGMWRMLAGRAKDLVVSLRDVDAGAAQGRARWEARYTFSATGRRVHNVVEARFTFEGGQILAHDDSFDLWRWAGMALGARGRLLGWTPFVQAAIRKKAAEGLDAYLRPA